MFDAIVDTNIYVRAFLKPDSSDGKIVHLAIDDLISLYYSHYSFEELLKVLGYPRLKKYGVTAEKIEIYLRLISGVGKLISPSKRITLCRDPHDNEFLSIAASVAESSQVYLITADKDLLVLKGKVDNVEIATPQEFLIKIYKR